MSEWTMCSARMRFAWIREGTRNGLKSIPTLLEWWMGWRR